MVRGPFLTLCTEQRVRPTISNMASSIMAVDRGTARYFQLFLLFYPLLMLYRLEQVCAQRERYNHANNILVKLPPELRDRIYRLVLPTGMKLGSHGPYPRSELSIMQTCRTVRKETIPIFYGMNTFMLTGEVHRSTPSAVTGCRACLRLL